MLATLAKVCSKDSDQFKLVNGRYISSSIADKNLTNVRLGIGANQGDNDPKRPGRTQVPTTSFRVLKQVQLLSDR